MSEVSGQKATFTVRVNLEVQLGTRNPKLETKNLSEHSTESRRQHATKFALHGFINFAVRFVDGRQN